MIEMIDKINLVMIAFTSSTGVLMLFKVQKQMLNIQMEMERIKMRLDLLELK